MNKNESNNKKKSKRVFLLSSAIALALCYNLTILNFEFWKENILKGFLKKC